MARTEWKLDLRVEADRSRVHEILTEHHIALDLDILRFVSLKLSADWLALRPLNIFTVPTGRTGTSGIGLKTWVEVVQSIYNLRAVPGIDEQIRRLGIRSHEALDTFLVLQVAGRYAREGLSVAFEPNGKGCSDLLVENEAHRFYVEVKRENQQDHKRFLSIDRRASELLELLEPKMRSWLEEKDVRLEIRFPRSFSSSSVAAITEEIVKQIPLGEVGKQTALNTIAGTKYVLLERQRPGHFQKGIHKGIIRVKQPGTPVQVSVQNMPVLISFDWTPNLVALKGRIQKASRQLNGDRAKDPEAVGFFVMEVSHGDAAKDAIVERYFSSLPQNCLGIVLLSDPGWVIPASGLPKEMFDVMALAAKTQ